MWPDRQCEGHLSVRENPSDNSLVDLSYLRVIDDVTHGTYNVIAWNGGLVSEPRPAGVPDGGATELDFVLR